MSDPSQALGLRPATPDPVPCKVCDGRARLFGLMDFNRSCEEARGKVLPLSGAAVYYRRCDTCGLVFTDAFDDWSNADFEARIYNDGYVDIDPDYVEARPNNNAAIVGQLFGGSADRLDVLDYGGGNGVLAQRLRERGFRSATTYDAFYPGFRERPNRKFNLVTCFETVEHMSDPVAGAADIVDLMADDGLLLISTMTQPADFERLRSAWWYIAPRNGHITLHSRPSLTHLFGRFGLQVASASDSEHMAFRTVPDFARHLLRA